jgi:uncharacterized protein DUF5681
MADELVTAENSGENSGRFQKGNPYRFPPKVSGNPGGRPRKPMTDAYADIAEQKYPGDPKGRTYAQLAAEGQFNAAIKGKTDAAREIADRLEGKAVQPVVGDDPAGTSVAVNIEVARKKLFGDDE